MRQYSATATSQQPLLLQQQHAASYQMLVHQL